MQGIGAAMKYFISVDFYLVLAGQALAGLAQPIYLSSPALMAASWFGESERTIAITVGGTFNAIGNMIGFFLPTIFVDPNASNDVARTQIRDSLLVQGIAGLILMVLAIFTFKNKPPTPSGPNMEWDRDPNLFGNLYKLITDIEYIKLMVIFTMYVNTTNVFGTLIDKIVEKYDFNTDDSGFFGTINVACGIVSWFLFGYFLNKTEMFKSSLVGIGITLAAAFVGLMFALKSKNKVYVTLAYGFIGITTSPLLVVWLTFCSKITYPINEATAGGLLQIPVQYFSFGISFLISDLINVFERDKGIFWMFMILILITLIGVFFSLILKQASAKRYDNEILSHKQSIEESENSFGTKNYNRMTKT